MVKHLVFCALGLYAVAPCPALAQEEADDALLEPEVPSTSELTLESLTTAELPPGSRRASILPDSVEVRGGPGAAYVVRGKLFAGDAVDVRRRNDGGDWIEVEAGGVRGWLRARHIKLIGRGAGDREPGDAGRDRRESNYTYDADGRRVGLDGQPAGSGEGAKGGRESPPDEVSDVTPQGGGDTLILRAGLGYGSVGRVFDSNIDRRSPLKSSEVNPAGLTVAVEGRLEAHAHVAVRAAFEGVFLSSASIPKNAEFGIQAPLKLAVDAQSAALDVIGRSPFDVGFGLGFAGVYMGGRYLRHSFQAAEPFPLFLTTHTVGLAAGLIAEATIAERFEVFGSGGYVLPLFVTQSPKDSGDLESGGGLEVRGGLGYRLDGPLSLVVSAGLLRMKHEFRGASTHAHVEAGGEPSTYSAARETDTVVSTTAGVHARF